MTERITTLHPQGKAGVNIERTKYDTIKQCILAVLDDEGEVTFGRLTEAVGARIGEQFDGSVSWYVTTVKLDLEARGLIKRQGGSPQRLVRVV